MSTLDALVERGLVAADWAEALTPVADRFDAVQEFLAAEDAAGRAWLPAPELVHRAFQRPLADVRVLIVGQDPYPTPGHPIGLSFAVERDVRPVPRSLANVYKELAADVGAPTPEHGDLSAWADQGVMLLNRVLTVQAGESGSHRRHGWEEITAQAVGALAARGGPAAAILWGGHARTLEPLLDPVPCVVSAHPSPLSVRYGFFGTKPFSRVNELLVEQGGEPIDWSLS